MFRGDQAEIGHELPGVLKARDVAEFCDHGCGRDQGHPAKRLEGVDHWRQSPVREHGLDLRRQPITTGRCSFDRCHTVFQDDVVRGLLEPQPSQPPTMHLRPGGAVIVEAVAQQKSGELLAGLPQATNRGQTCATEIPHRLMGKVGNPYRCQLASPMQLRQIDGIPAVGLDPIPGFAGDQRRSDHHAVVPRSGQLPLNDIATWTGLITEPQRRSRPGEFAPKTLQSRRRILDLSVFANFSTFAPVNQSDRNRLFVNVQTNVDDMLWPVSYA
ncbi:hypothetical protein IMCC20628_00945 [Hoeflea sp. IMCC20628]|nr:hypothetical protein IMCC20628_00945 [Hoeflea sp. IMCC20628]